MYRLIKIATNGHVPESVWWTDGNTLDEIAEDRIVALKFGGRWVCESGGKWTSADLCTRRLEQLPCWPEEAAPIEDVVADATEAAYIKYEPDGRGRWFGVTNDWERAA